jgi:hypothetical protein
MIPVMLKGRAELARRASFSEINFVCGTIIAGLLALWFECIKFDGQLVSVIELERRERKKSGVWLWGAWITKFFFFDPFRGRNED